MYMVFLRDGDCLGHTDIFIDPKDAMTCYFDAVRSGYDQVRMFDIEKMMDDEKCDYVIVGFKSKNFIEK